MHEVSKKYADPIFIIFLSYPSFPVKIRSAAIVNIEKILNKQ